MAFDENKRGEELFFGKDIYRNNVIGSIYFNAYPDPQLPLFNFKIIGEKEYNAIIDRSSIAGNGVIRNGGKYYFNYHESNGKCIIDSFDEIKQSQANGRLLNLGGSLKSKERSAFDEDCDSKYKGLRIALTLNGEATDFAYNNNEVTFNVNCGGQTYPCVINQFMSVDSSALLYSQMIKDDLCDTFDEDDDWSDFDFDVIPDYSFKGNLIGEKFYVFECVDKEENNEFDKYNVLAEKLGKDKAAKVYRMPEAEKSEIMDIITHGTIYPGVADCTRNKVFASLNDMKTKYTICKDFYPPDIRNAVEDTLSDGSLSLQQKTDILDKLINTRWGYNHQLNTDREMLKRHLDKSHYGLDWLKNLLIKIVIANANKIKNKGTNILLVGAPGVGKTSIVKEFAKAYNVPFAKISLNGIGTPCYLKGSHRLYANASIGQIMRTIRNIGDNSVILLDEFDKMAVDGKEGSPYSAFYDLLDRNELFVDEMIESGVDLSNTTFILTANDISVIPPAILDRVEIVYVNDYDADEKSLIARDYIIPNIMSEYNLDMDAIVWEEDVLRVLSDKYTLTNGLRDVKRNVKRIVETVKMEDELPVNINVDNIEHYLDIEPCDKNVIVKDIAGIKKKAMYYKDEYTDEVKHKIMDLFAEYDATSSFDRKEMIRKTLMYIVNILKSDGKIEYDIEKIKDALDESHYGMDDVKERVLMNVCARKVQKRGSVKCILLNGMSGIGKTTICKAIADGIGLPFVKIPLKGIQDSHYINGFVTTWKDSGPGIIVKELSEIGTKDAMILLDEFDKMIVSATNDPYSALLDLLDNGGGFMDSYIGVPLDLSDAFIIATSNSLDNIPYYILDRFEIIDMGGYSRGEKIKITTEYIIPKKLRQYSLENKVEFNHAAIKVLVQDYCKSFGMRDVEKSVEKILEKLLLDHNCVMDSYTITKRDVERILKEKPFNRGNVSAKQRPGVARALAVSGNEGTTFAIQVVETPFDDDETGLVKQSVIDSIKIAKLLVRKRLGRDLPKLHIHFSEGGIEKDGPSAGLTIFSAIYSYLTNIAIGTDTGFTGEVDIYGDVWSIGGDELKIIAAVNAGCKRVIIPAENYLRLKAAGKLELFGCEIIPVNTVDDVIEILFDAGVMVS